ncbi:15944_t:CDS:2 [Funneliformis geosporum]|uniref:18977_t:CDS:1 n=1 Tax=Funneliformis geosporum TaxID=1117311 RepID=A0A9W4SDH8_9GLOM|nr:18977_t:CDS:2 [Funneliformis geosporum]CAI2169821.1 15944_t:CDS:2 [Funneliformis geosporum]
MESKETYYEILGIETDASEDDIRKAYRKQALLWHPDKNVQRKEESEAKFKKIAEAYEVLSDTNKKQIYDRYGEEGLKNGGPNDDERNHYRPNYHQFQFHDPEEIFRSFFGGSFSEVFGSSFFDTGFNQPPFGMPSFGAGIHRSTALNDPFPSPFGNSLFGNFGNMGLPMATSSFSSSFSSNSFSGGSQGGFVKKSTTTQFINGVMKTVTTTEDAQGNVTVVTETSDGRRQILNSRSSDAPHNVNHEIQGIPIQNEGLSQPRQNQFQGQTPPYQQQFQQFQSDRHSSSDHHKHGFFHRKR